MLRRLGVSAVLVVASLGTTALAQNTNSSQTVRPRTATTNTNNAATESRQRTDVQKPTTTAPAVRRTEPKPKIAVTTAPAGSVTEAFNALLNGIRNADVNAVTSVYWNSPRLILFNSNGTITKGWDQMRRNRESSYREMKDVKLGSCNAQECEVVSGLDEGARLAPVVEVKRG